MKNTNLSSSPRRMFSIHMPLLSLQETINDSPCKIGRTHENEYAGDNQHEFEEEIMCSWVDAVSLNISIIIMNN
ncbi:unnamed protein product [Brassica rapa]|uniref:Uncharacterized protein n=1 Tax=Brassica campestris TaxID=3711 RepID=A0A8D9GE61_BRACM|nr:unnamed protein product [Brassica rapa]